MRNNTFCKAIKCQDANRHYLLNNKLCSISNKVHPALCPYLVEYIAPDGKALTYGASAIQIAAALAKSKYRKRKASTIRRLFRR